MAGVSSVWVVCATAAVASLVLARGVSAQAVPEPTLPRDDPADTAVTGSDQPPDTAATLPAAAGTSPDQQAAASPPGAGISLPAKWQYVLGLGAGYDNNIDFRAPNGPSSWAISPQGWLGRSFTGRRTRLRLSGGGVWYGYPDEPFFNRYDANFGLSLDHRASPGTTWQARAAYDLSYSDQSTVLSEQGVLLPLVRTRTAVADLGVVHSLGSETSLRLGADYSRVDFDENSVAARGLVTGETARGNAALRRTIGRWNSLSLQYSLGATLSRQAPGAFGVATTTPYYLTHFGSLQWEHVVSRRSALLLEGGASYTPASGTAGLPQPWSFFGGGTYDLRVRRSDLMLYVRRQVTPAFGLGVSRVQTSLGLRTIVAMGRAWSFRVSAAHSIPETPPDYPFTYGTYDDVFAGLSRRFGRRFSVWTGARYRRRGATGIDPEIDTYQAAIFLSVADDTGSGSSRIASPMGASY